MRRRSRRFHSVLVMSNELQRLLDSGHLLNQTERFPAKCDDQRVDKCRAYSDPLAYLPISDAAYHNLITPRRQRVGHDHAASGGGPRGEPLAAVRGLTRTENYHVRVAEGRACESSLDDVHH